MGNDLKFDDVLIHHIGEFGRFQWVMFALICFQEVFNAFHNMSPVFTADTPNHWCKHPDLNVLEACSLDLRFRLTVPEGDKGKCHMFAGSLTNISTDRFGQIACDTELVHERQNYTPVESCDSWIYDDNQYSETMVTKWDLVCDKAWLTKPIFAVFLGGRAFGALVFGWLADRFGRRKVILGAGLSSIIIGIVSGFIPYYGLYIAVRFLHGFFLAGKENTCFVVGSECVGPSKRVIFGSGFMMAWAVGYIILAGLGYLIKDWRTLILVTTVPEILFVILCYFFLQETPRWLFAVGKKEEGEKLVKKMADFNKKELPKDLSIAEHIEKSAASPIDLFKTPYIRLSSVILIFIWFANGLVYFGLSFSTSNLSGNKYINFMISGAVEIPAYVFIIVSFNHFGRIRPLALSMIAGGLALLLTIPIDPDSVAVTVLAMVGKFFISASFGMVWIYPAELYPTSIRSLGLNIPFIGARISAPIAPFVALLGAYSRAAPSVIFGSFALVVGILTFALPETKGKPLTQTVEDGEMFMKENRSKIWSICSCCCTSSSPPPSALSSSFSSLLQQHNPIDDQDIGSSSI